MRLASLAACSYDPRMELKHAPAWHTAEWLNAEASLTLEALRGRVVCLHAFQMLCPACVSDAIPQAKRVAEIFADAPLAVVGIHTVFEHHEAMRVPSLRAFLHEYRVRFPVGDSVLLGGEWRYSTAEADLDPSLGFFGNKLDLGGNSWLFTVAYKFR